MLDLGTGSRDFLDAETARSVLAPLLAAGAAHKQVSGPRAMRQQDAPEMRKPAERGAQYMHDYI